MIVTAIEQEVYQHPFFRFTQQYRVLYKYKGKISQRYKNIYFYQFQKSTRNSGAVLPDIAFLKKITASAKEKWNSHAGQYLNTAVGAI